MGRCAAQGSVLAGPPRPAPTRTTLGSVTLHAVGDCYIADCFNPRAHPLTPSGNAMASVSYRIKSRHPACLTELDLQGELYGSPGRIASLWSNGAKVTPRLPPHPAPPRPTLVSARPALHCTA